ncbi:MAG: hypothetical protein KDA20_07150 [Phycisphaerales bacterium]|nr:hypothetical protein [Phycisphaerales bacterium]
MRAFAAIILLCIVGSVAYGVIHDQFTARICIEYFTVTHPPLVNSTSPTVVALAWGVVATWWMGLILGFFVALCARLGRSLPKLTWKSFVVPLIVVLVIMGVGAALWGPAFRDLHVPTSVLRENPELYDWPVGISLDKRDAWLTCLGAHQASYTLGTVGGFALCIYAIAVRVLRARRAKRHPNPPPPGSHP